MNSKILILLLCVLAFSPVADAFNFGDVVEFFEEVFGPADVTGMVPGAECKTDLTCLQDEICYSKTCVQVCNSGEDEECWDALEKKEIKDPKTYECGQVTIGRTKSNICTVPVSKCGNGIVDEGEKM